jgi:hypothetical protein
MGMANNHSPNHNANRKSGPLGRFGFDKFLQLARNSFGVGKFNRAVDNCRLAVEHAVRSNNLKGAAEAYELWIDALMKLGKYTEVRKTCCDARSKFGNGIDLIYYEFKAVAAAGDYNIAARLGREFIEMSKNHNNTNDSLFANTIDKAQEVQQSLSEFEMRMHTQTSEAKLEKQHAQE